MKGETDLAILLRQMRPLLNEGEYVFCSVSEMNEKYWSEAVAMFREKEAITLIIPREMADALHLSYQLVFSWITLTVQSSLEAIGLTAAFATALSGKGISCNVVAAVHHDHIFIVQKDAGKAMEVLEGFAQPGDRV
jgi:uncharacterized protein